MSDPLMLQYQPFLPQQRLNMLDYTTSLGIAPADRTAPSAVVFQDDLYFFWHNNPDDQIYYTYYNELSSPKPINLGFFAGNIHVADTTSPRAIVYQNTLYVFYFSKSGFGLWFTSSQQPKLNEEGTAWTAPVPVPGTESVANAAGTDPCILIHQNILWVFWMTYDQRGPINFACFTGQKWTPFSTVPSINGSSIRTETSLTAASLNNTLYLFYQAFAGDGPYYATFTNNTWSPQATSVAASVPNISVNVGVGPASVVIANSYIMLIWVGTANDIWYVTTLDGVNWNAPQHSLAAEIGGMGTWANSGVTSVVYRDITYIAWTSSSDEALYFTRRWRPGAPPVSP